MRGIDKIILHCSDTPNGRNDGASDIHDWHRQRGFDGIGYHYVITIDGDIQPGRPEYWQGAHCKGHNESSIGICLIGRDDFNKSQHRTLYRLILQLLGTYDLSHHDIWGHYELNENKTCPNIDMDEFRSKIKCMWEV